MFTYLLKMFKTSKSSLSLDVFFFTSSLFFSQSLPPGQPYPSSLGSGDSSVVRASDSLSKGPGFESGQ